MSSKTQRQRMLAGETYNCLDPDLEIERRGVKALLRLYNQAADGAERQHILERILGHIGEGSMIEPPFFCTYGQNLYLGDHVYLNTSCVVLDNNEVRVGNHVMVGPAVQIYTAAHPLEAKARIQGWEVAKPVHINDNAWLGGGAVILPGIEIGRNAVVGAGAVVSHSVPPDTVVAGNPARVIRKVDQS